jgi:hypothetical protein
MLASSKAGHDKNKVYIIIREDERYVWLADGSARDQEHPKKKCKKHVQLIRPRQEDVAARLAAGETVRDEEIKRVIRSYEQSRNQS